MKFFLDTADLDEIKEAASWGALAGVTTNPTLYSRIGGKLDDFHNHIARICEIVDGPVSAESVDMTLCFTVPQAILAARAGARYISPFVGRFDDISEDGLSQLENVVTAINNYDYSENTVNHEQVEIIAASIRSANHVTQAALMGADIATVPFNVLKKMIQHPLTDRGLESFLKDWEKVANA